MQMPDNSWLDTLSLHGQIALIIAIRHTHREELEDYSKSEPYVTAMCGPLGIYIASNEAAEFMESCHSGWKRIKGNTYVL